jgi:hypothetical protein
VSLDRGFGDSIIKSLAEQLATAQDIYVIPTRPADSLNMRRVGRPDY